MPTAANATQHRPSDLISQLQSNDSATKLKAVREVKNQIIGNRTKKLAFIKLGVVPTLASFLADSADDDSSNSKNCSPRTNILVQSAVTLGSFACGFEAGAQAVLDAGAFPLLLRLLSYPDEKVVEAAARSLRMIYQTNLAPKYDFSQEKNMDFVLSLLNNENENVSGLGASIITQSCVASAEQKILCDAGVFGKLINLLEGSLSQRDASLEALAKILENNHEVVSKFVGVEGGRSLNSVIELTKDTYPRTRLLASMCLTVIRNTSPCFLQCVASETIINILLQLLEDPGQAGNEAPFAFSSLIAEKVDMQIAALRLDAIEKLHSQLEKDPLHPKRVEGLLLALADMCSILEDCRSRFMSLQVLNLVTGALAHDKADVRAAACICLKSVSRSVKNLSAGRFLSQQVLVPLIQCLHDSSAYVLVAALGVVSNIVVDFGAEKSKFIECGGLEQLIELSKSMDPALRVNSLWALRNLMFLADNKRKQLVFSELKASLIATLINDPEPFVREQALGLVRNLVDGNTGTLDYVFHDGGVILDAVGRQLLHASGTGTWLQGMHVFTNVASGNEEHKEAVMNQLCRQAADKNPHFMLNFLQSSDSRLRTATVWAIINLTSPSSPGAFARHSKLRHVGIASQIKNMVNDPCLDVKRKNASFVPISHLYKNHFSIFPEAQKKKVI